MFTRFLTAIRQSFNRSADDTEEVLVREARERGAQLMTRVTDAFLEGAASQGDTLVLRVDVAVAPASTRHVPSPLPDRIRGAINGTPRRIGQLASELGVTPDDIRAHAPDGVSVTPNGWVRT